ncbi:MAG: type II toxin-antitoxin system RelE/ParE family toxin [Candidatus Marsarchaeota archaeon]|nr:type II toxin-antitoxin system RelE/ParE family toxin [Candidatus Marsarchaeota archaeon]
MDYALEYSEESVAQLERTDRAQARRIIRKLESILSDPLHSFERLSGRPEYKLRVGDYRIIANIDEQKRKVFVRSLGHRKNVYKRH